MTAPPAARDAHLENYATLYFLRGLLSGSSRLDLDAGAAAVCLLDAFGFALGFALGFGFGGGASSSSSSSSSSSLRRPRRPERSDGSSRAGRAFGFGLGTIISAVSLVLTRVAFCDDRGRGDGAAVTGPEPGRGAPPPV